jgi:hypothetical protein
MPWHDLGHTTWWTPCVARLAARHPPDAAELLAQVQVIIWEFDIYSKVGARSALQKSNLERDV